MTCTMASARHEEVGSPNRDINGHPGMYPKTHSPAYIADVAQKLVAEAFSFGSPPAQANKALRKC